MKVRISDIPEEGLIVSERFDPTEHELNTLDLRFTEPVQVTAEFQKQQDTVWVAVSAASATEERCGRCLEPSRQRYSGRFTLDYPSEGRTDLDVNDEIRQEIILSYPVKFICRENCRGLCPQCGINLNERSCTHASSEA